MDQNQEIAIVSLLKIHPFGFHKKNGRIFLHHEKFT